MGIFLELYWNSMNWVKFGWLLVSRSLATRTQPVTTDNAQQFDADQGAQEGRGEVLNNRSVPSRPSATSWISCNMGLQRQTQNKDLDRGSSSQRIMKITDKSKSQTNQIQLTTQIFLLSSGWLIVANYRSGFFGGVFCKLLFRAIYLQIDVPENIFANCCSCFLSIC